MYCLLGRTPTFLGRRWGCLEENAKLGIKSLYCINGWNEFWKGDFRVVGKARDQRGTRSIDRLLNIRVNCRLFTHAFPKIRINTIHHASRHPPICLSLNSFECNSCKCLLSLLSSRRLHCFLYTYQRVCSHFLLSNSCSPHSLLHHLPITSP